MGQTRRDFLVRLGQTIAASCNLPGISAENVMSVLASSNVKTVRMTALDFAMRRWVKEVHKWGQGRPFGLEIARKGGLITAQNPGNIWISEEVFRTVNPTPSELVEAYQKLKMKPQLNAQEKAVKDLYDRMRGKAAEAREQLGTGLKRDLFRQTEDLIKEWESLPPEIRQAAIDFEDVPADFFEKNIGDVKPDEYVLKKIRHISKQPELEYEAERKRLGDEIRDLNRALFADMASARKAIWPGEEYPSPKRFFLNKKKLEGNENYQVGDHDYTVSQWRARVIPANEGKWR